MSLLYKIQHHNTQSAMLYICSVQQFLSKGVAQWLLWAGSWAEHKKITNEIIYLGHIPTHSLEQAPPPEHTRVHARTKHTHTTHTLITLILLTYSMEKSPS
jgi:hypothetical protein